SVVEVVVGVMVRRVMHVLDERRPVNAIGVGRVIARTPEERVGDAVLGFEQVVTIVAIDQIMARSALKRVVPRSAVDGHGIVHRASRGEEVVAAAKVHPNTADMMGTDGTQHVVIDLDKDLAVIVLADEHAVRRVVTRNRQDARCKAGRDRHEPPWF
ncbi:MAG: hypothetical protein M3478_00155, partial [Planctomycetota bacterium]|nr:hypothetical protein [Planctomycetota bacterium]